MEYMEQINCLGIGFNFGSFQLWSLENNPQGPHLIYSSDGNHSLYFIKYG
jgi:hypothetical protein